jgi:hypothetical protein
MEKYPVKLGNCMGCINGKRRFETLLRRNYCQKLLFDTKFSPWQATPIAKQAPKTALMQFISHAPAFFICLP